MPRLLSTTNTAATTMQRMSLLPDQPPPPSPPTKPKLSAKLLNRHQWREGDVALLEAATARLGLHVPGMPWETD